MRTEAQTREDFVKRCWTYSRNIIVRLLTIESLDELKALKKVADERLTIIIDEEIDRRTIAYIEQVKVE